MIRRLALLAMWFVVGAVVTAAPFIVRGHLTHAAEAARGEETMGPGIVTALGLLAAPIGGVVAVLVAVWIERRRKRHPLP